MKLSDPWLIYLFIFASISTCTTISVILHLLFTKTKEIREDIRIKFVFILHVTILLEDISNLPEVYIHNPGICGFMGWLHYYSGLSNAIVILFMGLHYFSFLQYEWLSQDLEKWLYHYANHFIFLFPLITLLPFSQNAYSIEDNLWCTLPSTNTIANNWSIGIFYFWVILFLTTSMIQLFHAFYRFYFFQLHLSLRLFYSVGVYIVITICCWLPRVLPRLIVYFRNLNTSNVFQIQIISVFYLSGILCAFFYVIDTCYLSQDRSLSVSKDHHGNMELSAAAMEDILRGIHLSESNPNPMHRSTLSNESKENQLA